MRPGDKNLFDEPGAFEREQPGTLLSASLNRALAMSQPHLLQLARSQGIPPADADDIVQETLIEAWKHLDQLRSPERFEAWLSGICHNICLRWQRTRSMTNARLVDLSTFSSTANDERTSAWEEEIADPYALDPVEELSRQDMEILLDCALSHLSKEDRAAVELHYLEELSQREVASRLELSIKALEVRLVRARRKLRQILNTELRTEAETFGLLLDPITDTGWHETRIWCMFCARHYLQGRFDTLPDGRVDLLMRCPNCFDGEPRAWIKTGGFPELSGLTSFRPAWKRIQRLAIDYWFRQHCFWCRSSVPIRLVSLAEMPAWLQPWHGLRFVRECPVCGSNSSFFVGAFVWLHPLAQDFVTQHPRWINEPEIVTEFAGQPVFRARLTDITSAARLTLMLHRDTLEVLACFQE
jgi:RNA polymerase sigma-70 factor (ECF subfamily)